MEWYEQHVQAGKARPDKKAEGYGVKRPAATAHKGGNPFRKESGVFKEKPTIEDRERHLNEKEEGDSKGGLPITKEPCVSKAKPSIEDRAGHPDDYMTDLDKLMAHPAKRRKSALNWHHSDYV